MEKIYIEIVVLEYVLRFGYTNREEEDTKRLIELRKIYYQWPNAPHHHALMKQLKKRVADSLFATTTTSNNSMKVKKIPTPLRSAEPGEGAYVPKPKQREKNNSLLKSGKQDHTNVPNVESESPKPKR